MKPLKLTLCNFCSYVGEDNVIDFTKFGPKGLYVITGPKGAGKSTIFDGITFALYGKKSNGLGRDSVRSKYAPEEGETFVEFAFQYGDKRFVIKRSFNVKRTRSKNLDKSESVEITEYQPGCEPKIYTGKTKALNETIENDIIKLTFDQFTQIIMLVQGDFKKLLKANNDEKRAIFQKIFNTSRYAAYEREFELKSAQLKSHNNEERLKFVERLKQIVCPADFEAAATFTGYKEAEFSDRFKDTIELLAAIIEHQKGQLAAYLLEKEAQQALAKDYAARITKAEQQKKLQEDIASLTQQLANEEQPLTAAKAELERLNATYAGELERFSRELAVLDSQKANVEKLAEAEQQEQQGQQKLKQLAQENTELQASIDQCEAQLEANVQSIKALDKELIPSTELERSGRELDNQRNTLAKASQALADLDKENARLVQKETDLAAKLAEVEQAAQKQTELVEEAKAAELSLANLRNQYRDCETALKNAEAMLSQGNKYANALAETQAAKAAYQQAFEKMLQQDSHAKRLEQIYKDSLAGLWALELKEGAACPVCGSTHHPHKAQPLHKELREADVESAKAELDNLKTAANLAGAEAQAKQTKEAELLAELQKEANQLYGLTNFAEIKERAAKEKEQSTELKAELMVQGKQTKAVFEQIPQRQAQLEKLQKELQQLEDNKISLAKDLSTLKGQATMAVKTLRQAILEPASEAVATNEAYQELQKALPAADEDLPAYASQILDFYAQELLSHAAKVEQNNSRLARKEALLKANLEQEAQKQTAQEKLLANTVESGRLEGSLATLSKTVQELKALVGELSLADIQVKQRELNEHKQALITAKTAAEEGYTLLKDGYQECLTKRSGLEEALKELTAAGLETEAAEALTQLGAEAEAAAETANAKWLQLHTELELNRAIYEQCANKTQELEQAAHKAAAWERLARLVNGKLPGKTNKSLEIFVQQAYLEKILARAHDKLMLMTDGQYEFKRRLEEARSNTVTGLGINVVHHTNESLRPVDTLSGGESFAAALALSLAVADEIQSSSGGVRLDSMFIDEGFGSLDSESLGLALRVLNDLSDNNYLIGIISHVKELEDNIEKKLEVRKAEDSEKISEFSYVV